MKKSNFNFIRHHLINKIYDQIKEKQNILKHDHFFYFDVPIETSNGLLNRVNRWYPYMKNDILPRTFYGIDGVSLIEVFKKLKNNDFYIYKNISGKSHKIRIKKK